jgi:ABC-type nickel/cobalt efflux system permease component RcnA
VCATAQATSVQALVHVSGFDRVLTGGASRRSSSAYTIATAYEVVAVLLVLGVGAYVVRGCLRQRQRRKVGAQREEATVRRAKGGGAYYF